MAIVNDARGKRILIFNADDFGRSEHENEAIERTISEGPVRSITVMANMPAASCIRKVVSIYPDISVGIHINLTEGKPVLDPNKISSLVGTDGYFVDKWELLLRCLYGRVKHQEVAREVRAQIEQVINWIGEVSHVDSHQNIHIYPIILPAIIKVVKDLRILRMRTQRAYFASHWFTFGNFIRWLIRTFQQMKIDKEGILSPYFTIPMSSLEYKADFTMSDLFKYFRAILKGLPRGKVVEVCCHPGLSTLEADLLCSSELKAFINSKKIKVSNFKVLKKG